MGKLKVLFLLLLVNVSAFSITIKDVLGREVTISKPINKIIALGTSLSYITYLNSVDKVIGIEAIELKDIKKRSYTFANKDMVKNLPIIGQGGKGKRINLEAIIVLNPDIVFTITTDKNEADLLSKQLNKPVVVVSYGINNVDFNYIYKSLEIMGKLLNKEKRATELVNYMNKLRGEFVRVKKRKDAYIGGVAYKGYHGITSTKTDFMPFRVSFVNNISSNLQSKGQLFIDKEFLLMNNPNSLFIDVAGISLVKDDFYKNPKFYEKLKAFDNNSYLLLANVFYFVNIDNMLANSFFIAKTLYPQIYKELNPIKKADEIFNFFIGKPMYKVIKEDSGGFKKIHIKDDNLVFESISYDRS